MRYQVTLHGDDAEEFGELADWLEAEHGITTNAGALRWLLRNNEAPV